MKANIILSWLVENWFLVIALIACIATVVIFVIRFLGLPTEKQKEKVKEWLIWACIEAEKDLQSGTGQLKLRRVYDVFCAVPAFTWVARIIPFKQFSEWVSTAVITMKEMLINNKALAVYVYGENATEQVAYLKQQMEENK